MNKLTKLVVLNRKLIATIVSGLTILYAVYLNLFNIEQNLFQIIITWISAITLLGIITACMFTFTFLFLGGCAYLISNIFDFLDNLEKHLKQ
jgi:hypothetical protein